MRIARADVRRLELKLSEPYTIAYDSYDHATNFLLRIEDDRGGFGQGCAAPAPEVTGEEFGACEAALRQAAAAIAGTWLGALWPLGTVDATATPAAAAALDMALLDLRARRLGVPLDGLLGCARPRVATSITLGIMATELMLERASDHVAAGFTALKVKGGHHRSDDAERLHALRERLGPAVELRFDANQGYGVADALQLARDIAGLGVTVLEQPTPAADVGALGEITRGLRQLRASGLDVPLLMADESATDLVTSTRLLLDDRVEALNVKLMKIGGISPAVALDRIAAALDCPVMVSCMDETALAIAAGLHFALSSANVRWVDLDGHLDLVDDPSHGAVLLRQGELEPAAGPGLGCRDLA